ncbi:uncharacterized protein LOC144101142 [Amblyomma americanum]|uniref:Single domain-containing protein n=1 Tax=Amblyomma americanum TaxID=6943 RepID=A0AAQ4FBV2_AMBAM
MMYRVLALVLFLAAFHSHTTSSETTKPTTAGEAHPPVPAGPVPTLEVKDVVVVGGRCSWGGLMLEPTTLNLMKEPCEAWTCDAENFTITIQRCGDFQVPQHCELEASLEAFPSCCPILVCGGV